MNYKELGDSFFCGQLEELVDNSPYLSFVLLSSILEFMGHCYRSGQGSKNNTRGIFLNLINNVKALEEYKKLNFPAYDPRSGKDIDNNYLYKYLRCGMLHEMIPKKDIVLSPDKNDMSQKTVGARNLYEDMKKAWDELKSSPNILSYMEKTDALNVDDELSGSTISSIVSTANENSQQCESESNLEDEWKTITETQ